MLSGGAHVGIDLLAAKVYRPREHRGFKDASVYTQGRVIVNSRMRRAVENRSKKGLSMAFDLWSGHEAATLTALHNAGVPVPRLVTTGENVLLMEFIGDENEAAPRLADFALSPKDARRCLPQVLDDVERMLAAGHIHGDLSPYNLLYWNEKVTFIDVPQTVNPWENDDAYGLLVRDLTNVLDYFAAHGARCPYPEPTARTLWEHTQNGVRGRMVRGNGY